MNILAVVPARGGSKAIPRKNVALLCGRPLIAYTVEEALKVDRLTDVVVSTDDEEIADIARDLGALVPFIRPAELASDAAQSAPVIEHALLYMEDEKRITYDAILMLQPTTPLRTAAHIDHAVDLFLNRDCDSVVSVVSVGGYHPFRMKRLVDDRLVNFIDQGFWDMRPRQDLPPVYIRNGAIYLLRRSVLVEQRQLIGQRPVGYVMTPEESVNIDSRLDLLVAEALLKERRK